MKKIILPFIYFFAFSITTFSQLQFTNYTNKNDIRGIAVKGDSVWIATTCGVVLRNIDGTLIATYTTDEGLPQNDITAILADSQGNIWCGTNNGVVKFDESGMTQVPEVYSAELIFEDSKGNIWFARNWDGATKFDGSSWTTYTTSDGLPYNYVYTIFEDSQGNMWFGYAWNEFGVTKFDGTNWTTYTTNEGLAGNRVYDIEEDNSGNMWFGTDNSGVSKFDGSAWNTYSGSNVLLGDNVYDILNDSSGKLWFGIRGYGINMYDGSDWYSYTSSDSLSSNYNYCIFEDSYGNIWFHGYYLDKFDGTQFTNYTTSDGLSGYGMYENMLAEDKMGNLWIGQNYGYKGLDKFDGSIFTNYIVDYDINSNYFYDILKDYNGDLWFAVSGADSLLKFDGTDWSYPGYHMGINTSYAYKIFEDKDNNLWFGYYELGKWDGNIWTYYDQSTRSGSQEIQAIAQDLSGNLWFGGTYNYYADGVNKFDGVTWTTYTTADGLDTTKVDDILADSQGNVWFAHGYYGTGVTKYDGSTFTIITPDNGIYSDRVYSVFEDSKGNIWLGQNYAVSKFDGNNWSYFSSSEGFPGGYVYDITEDEFGILWFATSYGLVKYDNVNWLHYTVENSGLVNNYLQTIEIDDQGNKWVGGSYGLSVASCQNPVASFTYSGASYPDTVEFTNTSTLVNDLSRYEWDFDNDAVTDSTTQDAKHVFDTAGIYPVKLIAWNDNCKDSIIQDVTIEDLSLKGEYTIGPGGDYPTFNAAVNDLVAFGVSDHVNFFVLDSVYNEQVVIPQIPGASNTSQISFISQNRLGAKLNFSPTTATDNYTLKLNSADFVTFKYMIISSSGNDYARVIEITNESSNNYFYYNKITGNKTGDSSLDKALVYSGNSSHDNNNRFIRNTFMFGSYGIYLSCSGPPYEIGTNLSNNTFTNQSYMAIDLNYQVAPSVYNNKITASTDSPFTGISLAYCNGSIIIDRNEILAMNSNGGFGIILTNSSSSSGNEGIISNNFIQLNTKPGFECRGIWHNMTTGTSHHKIYHNTVNITGDNPGSECARITDDASSDTLYIVNNIASNMAGGYCFYVDGIIGDITVDYNCYYTTGPYFAFSGQNFATLSNWQLYDPDSDQHSVSTNPKYISFTDLHIKNSALKAGTPLTEVTLDIDGDPRDGFIPFIGADEALSNVTFNVNMTYWKELGQFDPTNDTVDIAGDFNNWGTPVVWMDDYQGDLIYTINYQFPIGRNIQYKFRIDGSLSGPDRTYTVKPGDNILDHWFNDDIPDTLTFGNINQAFRIWFNATQYHSPAMAMGFMADQFTTDRPWLGSDVSSEPREVFSNSRLNNTERYIYRYWNQLYDVVFIVNDALKQIEAGTDVGTGGEHNEMVKAWCYFIQGITHGYLGLVFDQAFIIDETTDTSNLVLKPYSDVINAATGYLDKAISIANSNTFTLPDGWINGYFYSNLELAKLASSFAARLLIYSPRNVWNETVDWTRVLNYANNGITKDFSPLLTSSSDNRWQDYYVRYGSAFWYNIFVDHRIIHLMDPNYPGKWPVDGVTWSTPDGQDPGQATSSDARLLSDFEYQESSPFDPDMGYYRFSHYWHKRYQNIYSGYKPNFLLAENDLIRAEANLKLGNSSSAMDILNAGSWVTRGGLTALASASDEEISNAIFYERDIELILSGMGIGYFDMRRRDLLQRGTLLHFPVPAEILEENNMDVYTYGGENNADGINTALGWNSWDGGVYVTIDKTSCNPTNDWILTIHATGDNPTFQYSVDNAVTFQSDSNFYYLSEGTYNILVKNALGDTSEVKQVTLTILADSVNSQRNSCFGLNNGLIDIFPYGGVPPYTYSWTNGSTTEDIYNLAPGQYTVTITDYIGCIATHDFTIDENPEVPAEITGPTDVLLGETGTYSLSEPVTYKAYWYASDGIVDYNYSDRYNFADSVDVTWTSAGLEYVWVRNIDENNCYSYDTLYVRVTNYNQPVADAGPDQNVDEFSTVYLDGTFSYDPNNDNLTYIWYSSPEIRLSNDSVVNPAFTAPIITGDTTYYFGLVVNDGYFNSLPDTVSITTVNQVDITVSSYPYDEDFESGIGGWHPGGTNSSWQLGTPAGSTINSAYSGNYVWTTNLTGDYNASEISWVTSPQFDLSSLDFPKIEFSIWWYAEGFYDGANFQYKEAAGEWKTLGTDEGDDSWYNSSYLYSIEKGFEFDMDKSAGWSGDDEWGYGSNGWVTVDHALTGIDYQSAYVTFRIAFASNSGYENDGVAFDNIYISDDPTGIDQVETGLSDIQIYPNPNEGKFRLVYNGERDIDLKLQLINIQGQVILSEQIKAGHRFNKEFELEYLSAGIYYFRLMNREGVVVKKMVVR